VQALAYGPEGLYAATASRLYLFAHGARAVVARGLRNPIGLAVGHDGAVFVSESETNRILRFAPGTRARSVYASAGLDQPLGTRSPRTARCSSATATTAASSASVQAGD
jgi:hypothetical protein